MLMGKVCVDFIDCVWGFYGCWVGEVVWECCDGVVGFEICLGNMWICYYLVKC